MNAFVRPPVAPERQLHLFAVQLIRMTARPGVVYWHAANEGVRSPRTGAFLKLMGMRPGVSDLCFCLPPNGRLAALELKSGTGRLSAEQRHFGDDVVACGGLFATANTPEAVTEILREWGAIG